MRYKGRVFSVAGHHLGDPGASSPDGVYVERDMTIKARDAFVYFLGVRHPELEVIIDDDNDSLSQVIAKIRSVIGPNDLIIDFHYNSATPSASGVESVVNDNAGDFSLEVAAVLSKTISDIYGIPNRGVKRERDTPRKSLGITKLKGSAVVLEIAFLSNKEDVLKDQKLLFWAMEDCAIRVGILMEGGKK